MSVLTSDGIDFAPSPRVFAHVLQMIAATGQDGGTAVARERREAAFAAFATLARRAPAYPPRWRHRDVLRRFEDLVWSTGRLPIPPRRTGSLGLAPVRDAVSPDGAPSALAVANAGGLVHLGSTLLVSPDARDDPRFVLRSLSDAARAWPKRVAAYTVG